VPALLLAVALSATSCSGSSGGDLPPPAGGSTTTAGLETVAIRETILEFLDAYALSGETVQPLRRVVAGVEMRDWVHWVGVQNRHLVEATGRVEVRALRVLQVRDEVAAAAIDATITFTFVSGEGQDEAVIPRSFQSPMILARRDGPGSWAVINVVRDGRSMTDSITVLDPPIVARRRGVVVELVSVYRFTSGTVVNMRVRNTGSRTVSVDRERSVLQVAGQVLQPLGSTASLSEPLPRRGSVQAAFDFPNMALTSVPESLLLRLLGEAEPIALAFPAEAFGQGA
jgi:hypothetical protein